MTHTHTLVLHTSAGPTPVQAHPTDTDGLYVHRAHDNDKWVLSHHSGLILGSFTYEPHAYNAAKLLAGITDWTQPASQFHIDIATFIYDVVDAIHDADGTVLYRPPILHALAARGD
ncbi:hypothetical protein [Streptomyces lydicus]|uniref:hypothetical protein n=1 Tax=Streptomyces lydicus TaxID=47763 RepID=UPI00379BD96F